MSATKEVVITDKTALPFKPQPFCAAVKCNGMVYCSGIIGMDAKTLKLVEGPIGERVKCILNNMGGVLEDAGSSFKNIVKMNVYITSMDDFTALNEAYLKFFADGYVPARTCVEVKGLPMGTDVEIECIAHL